MLLSFPGNVLVEGKTAKWSVTVFKTGGGGEHWGLGSPSGIS